MAYCGPLGIPYSTFLGWPQLDQDAAIAWQRRDNSRCPSCAQYRDQLVDADGNALRGSRLPVQAIDWYCPGCAAAEGHDRARGDHDRAPGVSTVLMPVEVVEAWVASRDED